MNYELRVQDDELARHCTAGIDRRTVSLGRNFILYKAGTNIQFKDELNSQKTANLIYNSDSSENLFCTSTQLIALQFFTVGLEVEMSEI